MKNLILLLITFFFAFTTVNAQNVPQSFNWQGVITDASGDPLADTTVGLKFKINQNSAAGTTVYTQTKTLTTNSNGLINTTVGDAANATEFNGIDWGTSNYYLEVSVDISGGTSYTSLGAAQLLSVPYALYAGGVSNTASMEDTDKDTKIEVEQLDDEDQIRFTVNGTEKAIINNQGYFGINTSPTAPLEINVSDGVTVISDQVLNNIGSLTSITDPAWQSFTSGYTGLLHQIQFPTGNGVLNERVLTIYEGEGDGGTVLHTRTIPVSGPGWNLLEVGDIQILEGEKYTIHVSEAAGWYYTVGNQYLNGRSNFNTARDYLFETFVIRNDQSYKFSAEGIVFPNFTINSSAGTENQILAINGASQTYWKDDSDNQLLTLDANILSLTNDDTAIDLSSYLDNTDDQNLSITDNILSLSNDDSPIDLSPYLDADHLGDHTATQNITLSNFTLSNDGSTNGLQLNTAGRAILNGYSSSLSFKHTDDTTNSLDFITNLVDGYDSAQEISLQLNPGNTSSSKELMTWTGDRTVTVGDGTNGDLVVSNDITINNGDLTFADGTTQSTAALTDNLGNHTATQDVNLGTFAITDTDGDTKIQVEETSNDDVIRFDIAGAEAVSIKKDVSEIDILGGFTEPSGVLKLEQYGLYAKTNGGQTLTLEGALPGDVFPYARLDLRNSDNGVYTGASIRSYNQGGNSNGDLRFFTANNQVLSNALTLTKDGIINTNQNWISGDGDEEGLKINDAGNVGVNNVFGDVAFTVKDSGSNNSILLAEQNDGTNVFQIAANGNVGFRNSYTNVGVNIRDNGTNLRAFSIEASDGTDLFSVDGSGHINTNTNWISGDGDDEGISIADTGNVTVSDEFSLTNGNLKLNNNFLSNDGSDLGLSISDAGTVTVSGNLIAPNVYTNQLVSTNTSGTTDQSILVNGADWINFRTGNTGGQEAGSIFSHYGTSHYFVANKSNELRISYSTENSNSPSHASSTTIFELDSSGNLSLDGSLTQNSDARLKTEITPLNNTLDKIAQINGYYYQWKDAEQRGNQRQLGVIAQEVQKVYPELVKEDENGILSVNYAQMTAVLLEAIKEQQKLIQNSETRITELESNNQLLQKDNTSLKSDIRIIKEHLGLNNNTVSAEKN